MRLTPVLLLIASVATAQPSVAPGSVVRTREAAVTPRQGRVVSLAGDSFVVRFERDTVDTAIARARLELLSGTRSRKGEGAVIGAVTLGLTAWFVGSRLSRACATTPSGYDFCEQESGVEWILPGVFIGAGTGGLIGGTIRTNRWVSLKDR
jgi:hypothetical protein